MTDAIVQALPRDDVIKKGSAFCKTGKCERLRDCKLTLRGYAAPFRLEIYTDSIAGKVYSLENVKHIKYYGLFDQKFGLRIRFCNSASLYFTFLSEKEASEWMEGIQMHSLALPGRVATTKLRFHVILKPNSNCHLNGQYLLIVRDDAIRICDAQGLTPRIVWPVHTIRFYGNKGKMFSVATTSRSETGEGLFHFDALGPKEAMQIYDCVAASVSRLLQVVVFCPCVPAARPGRYLSHSVHTFNASSASDADGLSVNSFNLERIGASIKKSLKMPEIYGLSGPKRDLHDVFAAAPDLLERFAFSAVLYGPSNCGKQLLVESAAVHCEASLISLPARCLLQLEREHSDGIRMLVDVAMALAPCIVLIKRLECVPSVSESDRICRAMQKVKNAFGMQRRTTVAVMATISDFSAVDDRLLSFRWIARKIYVPPPCFETRRQVFAKELQGLLSSPEGSSYVDSLAQNAAGFDFLQLTELCRDVKKMAVSDAFDSETKDGRCVMRIRDVRKVTQTLDLSERRVYEESGLSCARYYASLHRRESAFFVVKLVASKGLSDVSHCFLRISDSSVDLLDLDPAHTIVSWDFNMIRQSRWTPLSFVLEAGRMSPNKVSEFHFETIAARTISNHLNAILHIKKEQLDSDR